MKLGASGGRREGISEVSSILCLRQMSQFSCEGKIIVEDFSDFTAAYAKFESE